MRSYFQKLLTVIALCFLYTASAQDRVNDAVGWFSLSVKQKISKHISYRVMARMRDGDNFTSVRSWYIDGGLYYHFKKDFSVSLNYVYAPVRGKDLHFRAFHQYYTSINKKFNLNNYWYFSNRVIFQYTSSAFLVDEGYKSYSRTDLREKLSLNRRVTRKDRIYIGDEIMTTLFTGITELRRNRFYLGLNHKFNRQFSVDAFFVLQSSCNRKINTNQYIYGLTLNYKFRKMIDDD